MGKKPDQIEQDIKAQREHISRRIDDLQTRVQDDIQTVRSEAKERANSTVGEAKGKLDDAKGSLNLDTVKSMVEEHTMSSIAGALGVGVLLGVVSEGLGGGGSNSGSQNGQRSSGQSNGSSGGGSSGLGGMIASIVGPAASTAQDELQQLVREGFSVAKEQVQQVKSSSNNSDVLVKNRDVGVE
jgi:ElaB/YqjD/DUF883 family membrane-anchored ribosome-binding protein